MNRHVRAGLVLVIGLALSLGAAAAAPFYCLRTTAPVRLDGVPDEPAWEGAPERELQRLGSLALLHPARFRAIWDDQALYLAFESCDQDLLALGSTRDAHLWEQDDILEVFLSVPGASFSHIELQLNPRNALFDARHGSGGSLAEAEAWNWPGIATAVRVDGTCNDLTRDRGWSAELRLPFAGLRELGVAPPSPAAPWRLLVASMNRVQIAPTRLSREKGFWPAPAEDRVDAVDGYARLCWVTARPVHLVEGFGRLVQGDCRRMDGLYPDYRGMSVPWECNTTVPGAELVWDSGRLPESLPDPVTFVFVGQTEQEGGPRQPERATFELWLEGRRLLTFAPFQTADCAWQEGDCQLGFTHRAALWHPSGLFRLQIPARLVTAGRPARFAIRATGQGPATRFTLKAYTDAALYSAGEGDSAR